MASISLACAALSVVKLAASAMRGPSQAGLDHRTYTVTPVAPTALMKVRRVICFADNIADMFDLLLKSKGSRRRRTSSNGAAVGCDLLPKSISPALGSPRTAVGGVRRGQDACP